MNDESKEREEHRGQPAPHLGADHFEKSRLEAAARKANGSTINPAVAPAAGEIGPTGVHPERLDDNGEPVEGQPASEASQKSIRLQASHTRTIKKVG